MERNSSVKETKVRQILLETQFSESSYVVNNFKFSVPQLSTNRTVFYYFTKRNVVENVSLYLSSLQARLRNKEKLLIASSTRNTSKTAIFLEYLLTRPLFPEEIVIQFILFLHRIRVKQQNALDFPLHRAVFEKNLHEIYKIVKSPLGFLYLGQVDPNGNTPLSLALKLDNENETKVLCDNGAEVKLQSFLGGETPIDVALSKPNDILIETLLNAVQKQRYSEWLQEKDKIRQTLLKIPDFSLEMKIGVDSTIFGLFSSLLAFDKFKISKQKASILVQLANNRPVLKSLSGVNAILIKEEQNSIEVYKIRDNKATDMVNELNFSDTAQKVRDLRRKGFKDKLYKTKTFKITAKNQEEQVEGRKCSKYVAKTEFAVSKFKAKASKKEILNLMFTDDFESYFSWRKPTKIQSVKENLSKPLSKPVSDNLDIKKQNLTMWVDESFPLKTSHFLPLIKILAFTSSEFTHLLRNLEECSLPFDSFPVQLSFPLGMSFHALLSISNFSSKIDESVKFELPQASTHHSPKKSMTNNFYDCYYKEKEQRGLCTESDEEDSATLEKYREMFETSVNQHEQRIYSSRECSTISNSTRRTFNLKCISKLRENKPKLKPFKTLRFKMAKPDRLKLIF